MSYRQGQLDEENSALIHNLLDYINTLKTNYNVAMRIGAANKKWICLILEQARYAEDLEINQAYMNRNAQDNNLWFGLPLPYTTVDLDGNAKNLYITQTKVGIEDAAEGDELDRVRWFGWTDFETDTDFLDTGAGLDEDTASEYTWDHADTQIGGVYERIVCMLKYIATNAGGLDLSYVKVEYYYG